MSPRRRTMSLGWPVDALLASLIPDAYREGDKLVTSFTTSEL